MEQSSRPESGDPSLREARELLGALPDGTYTLGDIGRRWPDRLRAAMVLAADFFRPRRQVSFHWAHGSGAINRTGRRHDDVPHLQSWPAGDIRFTIEAGKPIQVTVKPSP